MKNAISALILSSCLSFVAASAAAQSQDLVYDSTRNAASVSGTYSLESTEQTLRLEPYGAGTYIFYFDDEDAERWVLTARAASRGDTILRNDTNRIMLRLTAMGGAIYYDQRNDLGEPALPVQSRKSAAASYSISAHKDTVIPLSIQGRPLSFTGLEQGDHPLAHQVVAHIKAAFASLEVTPRGQDILDRITAIEIYEATESRVDMDGPTLMVHIDPALDLAGRPSSERIGWVIRRHAISSPVTGTADQTTSNLQSFGGGGPGN